MAILAINGAGVIGRAAAREILFRSYDRRRPPSSFIREKPPMVGLINDPAFADPAALKRHIVRGAKDRSDRQLLRDILAVNDGGFVAHEPQSFLSLGSAAGEPSGIFVTGFKSPQQLAEAYARLKEKDPNLVVIDCSRFAAEDPAFAQAHLEAGATRLVISAVAKKSDITVVYGANHEDLRPEHRVIADGSCTTNCISLPLSVIERAFGVKGGFMLTVHAVTTEQFIYDVPNADERKGRSLFNLIPTTTGAAKAVGDIVKSLKGKLDGFALRVPLFNGSIAITVLNPEKPVTTEELRTALKNAAETNLKGVMAYSSEKLVLEDVVIDHADVASVVDEQFTFVMGGMIVLTTWYNNIDGFTANLINLVEAVARLEVSAGRA
ncbi:type I glyceraldehyde-3-phosphate dehydrogenase [Candidatus Micrarchaeota archaeon]|nr:type I glyceraldehyde-3-phosphate dehydrogenase [Candidatus Micrarchaeota archaeon]